MCTHSLYETYDFDLWFWPMNGPMMLTYDFDLWFFIGHFIGVLTYDFDVWFLPMTWPRRRGEGTEAPRKADEDLIKNQVKIFQIYGEVLEWTENVTFQMATCPAGRKEPRTWQERSRWIIRRSWKQKRFPAILIVPSVLNTKTSILILSSV